MPLPSPPRRAAALLGAALAFAPLFGAAQPDDGAPPPPAADHPPTPAQLSPDALASAPASTALEATEGRWRIRFASGREDLSEASTRRVEDLGRRIAEAAATGRVTVEAQSSGPDTDVSAARRLSLARAQTVKAALANGGLPPTRIDLRALGRTPEAADTADILPPAARPSRGR